MDLLDRYLQAVGQYLPSETKADTLAELRANLLAQMEEREEELGRPLNQAEVAGVLKGHGRPEVVALRYLPQRSLIGPTIYPFYVFTLKRSFPLVVLVYAIVRGALLAVSAKPDNLGLEIWEIVSGFVPVALTYLATVTVIFAVFENGKKRFGGGVRGIEWDPEKLPAVASEAARKPTRTARIADLIGHWFALCYVLAAANYPFLILGAGVHSLHGTGVTLTASFHVFYDWVVAGMVAQLVLKAFDLRRQPRIGVEIAVKVVSVALVAMVVAARVYFVGAPGGSDVWGLNYGFSVGFRVLLVLAIVDLGRAIWMAVRGGGIGGRLGVVAGRVSR
jgi:hypothetical protein